MPGLPRINDLGGWLAEQRSSPWPRACTQQLATLLPSLVKASAKLLPSLKQAAHMWARHLSSGGCCTGRIAGCTCCSLHLPSP